MPEEEVVQEETQDEDLGDLLEDDEEVEEEGEVEVEKEGSEKEEGEEGENEDTEKVDEEPGFDDLEDSGAKGAVDLSAINKKFPGIAKDHPELREVVDRDIQYREMFPSLGQASDALRKSKALDDLNREIFQDGSLENLISVVHRQNPQATSRVARSIPDAVMKADKNAYFEMAQPIINDAIASFVQRVQQNPNKQIRETAKTFGRTMAKFINGDSIPDPSEKKLQDMNERDQQYFQTRARDANDYVGKRILQTIDGNLESKLSGISDYMKASVKRDVLSRIDEILSRDSNFQARRANLWQSAQRNGFDQNSLDSIVRAMLGQVKGLLPHVRAEILEKAGANPQTKKTRTRKVAGSSRKTSVAGKPRKFESQDYEKFSDEDILAM